MPTSRRRDDRGIDHRHGGGSHDNNRHQVIINELQRQLELKKDENETLKMIAKRLKFDKKCYKKLLQREQNYYMTHNKLLHEGIKWRDEALER